MTNSVSAERLQQHVEFLCQAPRAPHQAHYYASQSYLIKEIESFGLKARVHDFYDLAVGSCRNIFAEKGPAQGPRILIGAHYESIMCSGPAADDNASAVAVALEILKHAPENIPLTVVFFDIEERFGWSALRGSKAFSSWYPAPLKGVVIFDLVGGSLMPSLDQTYFQFGNFLSKLNAPPLEFLELPSLFLEPLGSWHARSDYKHFRDRGVPWSFFSIGTPWYYHTPQDRIENLRFDKMKSFCESILEQLQGDLGSGSVPDWSDFPRFLKHLESVPEFKQNWLKELNSRPPSRFEIIKLYKLILPKLRNEGPRLWS